MSADREDLDNWRGQLQRLAPLNLPLLPCGAGKEKKGPVDPETGDGLSRWQDKRFTVDQIRAMNGVVRSVGAITGHGLCALDFDGATTIELALEQGCDPQQATTWQVHRTTDPHRFKINFQLTPEQQQQLGKVTAKALTALPSNGSKGEALEVFHHPGRQVVILGEHPTSGGHYLWPDGYGPEALAPIPPNWWQLVLKIAAGELGIRPAPAGKQSSKSTNASGWKSLNPCPICGRNTTGWCTTKTDNGSINCRHGSTFSPLLAHGVLKKGQTITGTNGVVYGYCGDRVQRDGVTVSNFVVHKERPPRDHGQQQQQAAAEQRPKPKASAKPYRVLGWNSERTAIHYQHRQTGQIASIKPSAQPGQLLQLAPKGFWETFFPTRMGIDWAGACSDVIEDANHAGVFAVDRVRGRGLWIDGNSVIWHLGDRLEVDGQMVELIEHRSAHHYPRLPALDINPNVVPLSDAEGREILAAITAMGWATPLDPLHLLGWAVLANVGGALEKRPVLQITSRFGSGKTFTRERVLQPLLAGLAISRSNSTEAGIRQLLRADTLPVLIDESEGEDHSRREGHLRLARLSYDGSPTDRGTTHGQALSYAIRSSVAMVGINATINNPAERSRTVLVGREQLPQTEWAAVDRRLQELLTPETGARLLRRAVNYLPTLRANVATFRRAVEGQLGGGAAARAGDTYGALLAGAYLLTSSALVDDAQALDWLDTMNWSANDALGESGSEGQDTTAESRQCLAHLLGHEEPWRLLEDERGTGRISVRELVYLARLSSGADDAEQARKALGRRGIRATDSGLEVCNSAEALAPIYVKTKWRDGGHRARLLDLPGAYPAGTVRFPVLGSHRATKVPWEVVA